MIKKLLLFLVVITYLQNLYAQQATILANCFYESASDRIVIRLAIRNNTASGQDFELSGIRFGVQYNADAVTPAGYTSYMYELGDHYSSLNAFENLTCIGADTYTGGDGFSGTGLSISSTPAETSRVAYTQDSSISKVMQRRYFNRSSDICAASWGVPPNTYRVALDLYFTLNDTTKLSYYGLDNTSTYGFDSPDFIAQGMNSHTDYLKSSKSEIGIVLIRKNNCDVNPYQPFSWTTISCQNGKVNPITIDGDSTVNFISPANGVLAGKVEKLNAEERNDHVALDWNVENNDLVDHYEIERKEENGSFRTIGMIMSDNKASTTQYQFKDKITARDLKLYYRVKIVGVDRVITYSDIKMVRPGSVQQNVVKVFPNPTSDLIRFNAPLLNGYYVCRIYSNEGRMVLTANVSSANQSINIKNLKAGSYFIEIYSPQSDKRFYSQFSKF